MSSYYQQMIEGCLSGEHGAPQDDYAATLARTADSMAALRKRRDGEKMPLLTLPGQTDDLEMIEDFAAEIRQRFDRLVVIGTGGSSLGGKTLVSLPGAKFSDAAPEFPVDFLENVDYLTLDRLLAQIDVSRTFFLAVSKSGSTLETMSQLLLCLDALRDAVGKQRIAQHVAAITEPGSRILRDFCAGRSIRVLDHDPKVGGRFSVLSLVGLIPAAVAGINIRHVREGAASVIATLDGAPQSCPPAIGAAIGDCLRRRGTHSFVLMPYADRLADFGMWYRQLWAESLGKDGQGTLPVRAIGAIDQHSQLQLYLGGPRDKFFTCVLLDSRGRGRRINPALAGEERLAYMAGKTLGDVMVAEQEATVRTLSRNGCPTRLFRLTRLGEAELGALMMHYMLETVIAADLMGINAYDQPAVEESKVLARKLLSEMDARAAA